MVVARNREFESQEWLSAWCEIFRKNSAVTNITALETLSILLDSTTYAAYAFYEQL